MLADSELARRCENGDAAAWERLVAQYQKRIWHVAFQFTGRADEAEELTQEIFIHLLKVLKSFESSGSLPAWIQRVARNYAIDHYRRRRRERSLVSDGEEFDDAVRLTPDDSGEGDPHRSLEQQDRARFLRASIDKLPTELGQAVILRDLQGMTYDEMATLLKLPLGTVKSRINRGRVELARRLERKRAEWSAGPSKAPIGGDR